MINYSSSITYGKESISFNVLYVDRKTLDIAVHPDAQVIVKAPKGATPKGHSGPNGKARPMDHKTN